MKPAPTAPSPAEPIQGKLLDELKEICFEAAGGYAIKGACLYGSRVCGYAREDSDYDALLILSGYPEGVRYSYRRFGKVYAAVLAVDDRLFRLDAEKGALGEFVAGRLLAPYAPFINAGYLREVETALKKRVVEEEVEELILEYGELSRGLVIKPEYFILSRLRRRARAYSPLRYSYSNLLKERLKERNLALMKDGFLRALKLLNGRAVNFDGENATIEQTFIDKVLSRKVVEKVVNVAEFSRRALRSYLAHGVAGRVSPELVAKELTSKLIRGLALPSSAPLLEDPKLHLYLRTSKGLVNLNESASIRELVKKFFPGSPVAIMPLGGALNEVYLVTAGKEKVVAKRYSDWFGFKWFVLNLVALGAKVFSLSGRARLANEYGISQFLLDKGVPIQKVIFVSLPNKLLVKEFIEGEPLLDVIKACVRGDGLSPEESRAMFKAGKALGLIHSLGVALGDTKPENFLLAQGAVVPVDLEQSGKSGDPAWDVAEFLYYSGHYGLNATPGLKQMVETFLEGYLEAGSPAALKKAGGINYVKVFSFWTPAPILKLVSSILKNPPA